MARLSARYWRDVWWKDTLADELDRALWSPLKTRLYLCLQPTIQCKGGGKLLIARRVSLRISRQASLTICAGEVSIGFQLRGGRRFPTFNHSAFVVHAGGIVQIGGGAQICAGSIISVATGATLRIGDAVVVSPNSVLSCRHKVRIGVGSMFGWGLTLQDNDLHEIIYPSENGQVTRQERDHTITIGARVWAGHHVTILKGVTIGDDVIIGANAVVTKDVPGGCMVAGNPARVIHRGVRWHW